MNITEGLNGSKGLYFIIGTTMFANKTGELRRQVARLRSVGERVLVLTQKQDTRYGQDERSGLASSHDGATLEVRRVPFLKEDEEYAQYGWLVIDEAQMFGEGLVSFVKYYYRTLGKSIIVCGLVADCDDRKWGSILDLFPFGPTDVCWCRAICPSCRRRGATNSRLLPQFRGEATSPGATGNTELVGAADKYYVTCPDCDKQ